VVALHIILSGICASDVFVLSCERLKKSRLLSTTDNTTEKRFIFELTKTEDNIFIYGAGSLIVFKIFGGK
jgi:hypothetical protein